MLTLFHSPRSRSTRVIALLRELDALDEVQVRCVGIRRQDGSGGADSSNPHPEGKVPLLLDGDTEVWESSAIFAHLADLFPEAGLNVAPGHPQRGAYLSWLAWYSGVMEPVFNFEAAGLSHPLLQATFRGRVEMEARLVAALTAQPFLCGDRFTAADLLLHSPYAWFGKPGVPAIDAWVDRCEARASAAFAAEFDAARLAAGD